MRSFVLEEKGREKCPVEDFHLVEQASALGPLHNEMTPKERVLLEYYTKWEDMPGDPITARFINETQRAKWLPKGTVLGVKDLLWTCLQRDVMVEERGLWTRSLAIGMRACTLCQYTCLSAGSMLWTIDGEERTKLWRRTGMIR